MRPFLTVVVASAALLAAACSDTRTAGRSTTRPTTLDPDDDDYKHRHPTPDADDAQVDTRRRTVPGANDHLGDRTLEPDNDDYTQRHSSPGATDHTQARDADDPALPLTAQAFVDKAASSSMWEVESSQLVIDRTIGDASLLAFAQRMIVDHQAANDRLKQICQTKNLSVPSGMQVKHERMLDELRSQSGDAFATKYRQQQMTAHRQAIALFERAGRQLEDEDLKNFVEGTLPTLRLHLHMLEGEGSS